MDERIRASSDGAVTIVELHDPAHRNALDLAMREELATQLRAAHDDARCRAIVLAGAGGVFSAGGDIRSMTADDATIRRRMNALGDIVRALVTGPKPVVAAVDGYAYGMGLSLAAACDLVVASPSASFRCSFGGIGLTADCGLNWTLPRRVGESRARRMLLLGEPVTVAQAHDWGLVDVLTEDEASLAAALELAETLAQQAPLAIAATKRLGAHSAGPLDVVLAEEAREQTALLRSQDFTQAQQAFLDKRRPTFEGR